MATNDTSKGPDEPSEEASRPKYAVTTLRTLLEEVPPDTTVYVTDLVNVPENIRYYKTPDITAYCESESCAGDRLFRCGSNVYKAEGWGYHFLKYVCRNCGSRSIQFAIAFVTQKEPSATEPGVSVFVKLGQVPSFGPKTPTKLMNLVGPDRGIFLQGRRAENRGMGIGAFAYYRRVVENQKNRIIAEIAKVSKLLDSSPETDALFASALTETQFSKSVAMVKDVIPQTLMVHGHNPLLLLHSALSKGLHNPDMTDEHCLALAQSIRTILAELAERASEALKNNEEIENALSVLRTVPKGS